MAAHDLTVLAHPAFPQVFASALAQEVDRVDRILADYYALRTCSHESSESRPGTCDGGEPCREPANSILDGQAFCPKHLREALRG